MKAIEQQQPNSIDSSDSVTGSSEYAYRPLTTKHRRAGSTGTTGDEEYTTDEDEFYGDEADCAGTSLHPPHPILKSDLARAATDLFGYSSKPDNNDDDNEPTSLFDDDDGHLSPDSSFKMSPVCGNNKNLNSNASINEKNNIVRTLEDINSKQLKNETELIEFPRHARPLDLRMENNKIMPGLEIPEAKTQGHAEECVSNVDLMSSVDDPPSPTTLQWEKAVAEVKEHAITKLQEELKRAHEELKLKDEEVTRLSRFRQDVETELEELTANLFQEAHNMVREANTRQATAERLLEESRMKNEVLAAEVSALKTLVLTSTPAQPNPHLHPQIDIRSKSSSGSDDSQLGLFTKKHRRSPSHFNLKYGRENSPPESPVKEQKTSLPIEIHSSEKDITDRDPNKELRERDRDRDRDKDKDKETRDFGIEIDPILHSEFLRWKENPCIDKTDMFVARVFREDIDLCLNFPNEELGNKVRQAVLDGIIFIEAISDKTKLSFPRKCALLEVPRQCLYRMRIGDQENNWYSISQICRNRIIAVCEFLNYLRYIERGLVKSGVHDIFCEITRLRKEMVLARLGIALSS
ncbi:guanine nucleotide exchange factor for Rab-3A-like [Microplitis mediator]|uniref:guanine nucleotide exchange factor for Rab-3A-like n=1 Tax=Microplitis mediator TaxID=375433 RepID=UPI002555AF96|nr:guanine nucleotide exchange factor for Rab-3A-like [Microplitis mediator]XP_057340658.1 guanine nucleotide exchange factor for Rab-3A-like [Microplitis mediator]XP_057340659.1 guanine nucleotide exchange factor for Rab-3A-like [Microplitis mediator]XP_057340661.1 guanine nucleotide exchange factor for Rab-3A-like [Microplitis mediator]XP_057340662.1 guanine nucleotide exchange factor for Rab-3A-like [Microplitis mediator]